MVQVSSGKANVPIHTDMTWLLIIAVLVGFVAICLAILREGETARTRARRPSV